MHSQSIAENTPIGKLRTLFQQEDKSLEIVENDAPEPLSQPSVIRKSIIHFYFCMEGTATFEFGPHYVREIQRQHNYFFFDPGRELPFTLRMSPHSRMVVMTISLESLHQLFVHEPLPFLKPENINQKFYDEREIPSHLMVELNQLYNIHLSTSSNSIYYQGKILELLALYIATAASGAIAGLVSRNVLRIIFGLTMVPIISGIMVAIASLFFYYTFQIFIEKTISFRQLFTVGLFANLPFFILNIAADYLPPISLFGFAFTAILLSIGLVENFSLPKKMVIRLLAILYIIFILVWAWGRWDSMKVEKSFGKKEVIDAPEVRLGE
jgi:hypothetical protein